MKIIVLCGPGRCGKTTALKKLIEEVRKEGVTTVNNSKVEVMHGNGDMRVIISMRNHRIGICTGGDSAPIITDNFKFLQENACDIGISALRNNNKQWPLCQELIKLCKDDIPMFVWKTQRYGETKKWAEEDLDGMVVRQIIGMI